jgi:DNA-binding transcriptional ArsR family regulator
VAAARRAEAHQLPGFSVSGPRSPTVTWAWPELSEGTRCVHELVDALEISQSLASQHLRVLRASGLVTGVRRG